ncbi:MAG TPA: hypothetical protein VI356_18245 [Myxococcales bacterium]
MLIACATCFGAADSDQVKAAKIGVLVLLGFIVPLLVAIALIARSWARRARALQALEAQGFSAVTSLVRNASWEPVTRSPASAMRAARSSST